MTLVEQYKTFIPSNLSEESKVWIFQSSQIIPLESITDIATAMEEFTSQWKTHGDPVLSYAKIYWGQFFVFCAENTSGCSTDTLFRFVKQVDEKYNLCLLDRKLQAFLVNDNIQIIPFSQFAYAYQNHLITNDTLYFDNSISTVGELKTKWIIPVGQSWLLEAL